MRSKKGILDNIEIPQFTKRINEHFENFFDEFDKMSKNAEEQRQRVKEKLSRGPRRSTNDFSWLP